MTTADGPNNGNASMAKLFQAEIEKASGSFAFAADEGETESHKRAVYLQMSYDRYSRTIEDFLLLVRLFRRAPLLSSAQSAEWRKFEIDAARTLRDVQRCLCVSRNRLTKKGRKSNFEECERRQRKAASVFRELAMKLRVMPPLSESLV